MAIPHAWMLDVVDDLEQFMLKNGLNGSASEMRAAYGVIKAEITQLTQPPNRPKPDSRDGLRLVT